VKIVVVDDMSLVPIDELLPEHIVHRVTIIRNKNVLGQGGALNYAIRTTSADIYAFTDSDCIVSENWIDTIAAHYTNFPNHIGVTGPNWNFVTPASLWKLFLTRQESLLMRFIFESYIDHERNIAWRVDCRNMSLRTSFFDTFCFFPEGQGPAVSGQFSYRLRDILQNSGFVIGFNSNMLTYYVDSLVRQMLSYYKRGAQGEFSQIYTRGHGNIVQAFLNRYLYRHFVAPCLYGVSPAYVILVHGAFWIGILAQHKRGFLR